MKKYFTNKEGSNFVLKNNPDTTIEDIVLTSNSEERTITIQVKVKTKLLKNITK